MDGRDIFAEKFSDNFKLTRNTVEIENKIFAHNEIIEEFSKKGIIDLFISRDKGQIFRENGLTSIEAAELSKLAKESYIAIQNAALYNLSNPIETQKWLNTLAKYLNNYNINFDSYLKSGIPPISNPLESVIKELEEIGYNELKSDPITAEELAHNRVVNAYNVIKNFDFSRSSKEVIDRQLETIKPYVTNKLIIERIQRIDDYSNVQTKLEEYRNLLLKNGVIESILKILESYEYDHIEETEYVNTKANETEIDNPTYGMTEKQLEHNYVNLLYKEIKDYGCIVEPLKKQLDKQEDIFTDIINTEEVQIYLEKIKEKIGNSTFGAKKLQTKDIKEITTTHKIAIPAFIERFINKIYKQRTPQVEISQEELNLKQLLEVTPSNYDAFAYQLRDFKKYINDPTKPLNLSDGTNVAEELLIKATKMGIVDKTAEELIQQNPQSNPVLIHYVKKQIEDLIVYGCFLTSYCNDLIKKKGINLDIFKEEQSDKDESIIIPTNIINPNDISEIINEPSNIEKENDVKVMKKTMEPEKKMLSSEPEVKIENNPNQVVSTQISLNMSNLIKEITKPGMFQTDEERSLIQELWTITNNSSAEKINEIQEKIANLYPTKTKEKISETWNNFITEINQETVELDETKEVKEETKLEEVNQHKEEVQPVETNLETIATSILLDELAAIHTEILDKTGFDKGVRINEIHDEIKELTSELELAKNNEITTLDNALTIIETITKSEVKDNENFDEYIKNYIEQKTREITELSTMVRTLITEKNNTSEPVIEEFKNNFEAHRKTRDKIRKRKKTNEEELLKEKECAKTYQQIRSYYEQIQKLASSKDNQQLETIISDAKELISGIKEENGYSEKEIENLNKMQELMILEMGIIKGKTDVQRIYSELSEIKSIEKKNNEIELIQEKIKTLELEEDLLSFSPETTRKEIESLMTEKAGEEAISQKLDEYIMPIVTYNEEQEKRLILEIEALENKLANRENYLDESKIQLETEKRDNDNKQIESKTEQIEQLKKLLDNENHLALLENNKNILLEQKKNYEEEKQILLLWNVEESESNEATRTVLKELFEESKQNLESIQIEIEDCESQIAELKQPEIDVEKVTAQIAKLEEQKAKLITRSEKITKQLEKKTSTKYMNKELILSDTEELNRKKQELEKIRSIDLAAVKEQFLNSYSQEKVAVPMIETTKENAPLELPGVLENGNEIKADGTIVDNSKPLPLPGVLENGDVLKSDWQIDTSELKDEEIASITNPSPSLLEKAKAKFGAVKNKFFDWIKKHPKLAATIGAAVTMVVIGATIVIKSLSGEPLDNVEELKVPTDTTAETIADEIAQEVNATVEAVDKAIEEMENETGVSFENQYESAIDNILEGNQDVYVSADRAIDNVEAVNDIYEPSFETANINKLYKMEDGKLINISYEEAENIVENGGRISAAVENDGVDIGYVAIGGNDIVEENTTGMSK